MSDNNDTPPIALPAAELKALATAVAAEMKSAGTAIPAPLRERFVFVRAALFQRGIFDPVLVRFDSATVQRAPVAEVADQLESVAAAL